MFTPLERAYFTLQNSKYDCTKNIKRQGRIYRTYKVYTDTERYFYLLIDDNDKVYVTELYDDLENINVYDVYYYFNNLVFEYTNMI